MLNESELIKHYRLVRAGILFIDDLIRDVLTSLTERNNTITAEMKVIMTLGYLAIGKMQQCNSDDLGLLRPSISIVITQTITTLSQPHIITHFI